MAAVTNCSRRLLARSSSSTAALVPALALRLARPAATTPTAASSSSPASSSASFSTSAAAQAKPVQHIRSGKRSQTSRKKKVVLPSRSVAPGERKAYRKRIVLSNNNALEVPGLQELEADADPAADAGCMRALPDAVVDQLRAVQAFKPTQNLHLFRRPSLLVRDETAALTRRLQNDVAADKKTLRIVVDGERIAGKSTLLQQALAHGFLNGFLVLHIPEAHELTTACTEYAPLPGADPVQYVQPHYTYRLLQAVQAANAALLGQLTTARDHDRLATPVPAGSTLQQLIAAAREPDHAWPVFQALWAELLDAETSLPRPPVLLAADGLAHLMRVSDYRSPAFARIHAHDLVLVRFFVDALAGATRFPHGAAVLAATTYGSAPIIPSLRLALDQRRAEQQAAAAAAAAAAATGQPPDASAVPAREPYFRGYDERVEAALRTVEVLQLPGLSKPEARALLEYWAASGVLRQRVDSRMVAASWTLAGNGVVGEMERALLLSLSVR